MGFEPTPLRTGALSQRLRPLGQTVMADSSGKKTTTKTSLRQEMQNRRQRERSRGGSSPCPRGLAAQASAVDHSAKLRAVAATMRRPSRQAMWRLEAVILKSSAAKSLREEAQDSEWPSWSVFSIHGTLGHKLNALATAPLR